MNCKETAARLQTYLDRELSDSEVGEVRMHLAACPPCQNHFHFEEHLKKLVRDHSGNEQAPPSLRVRIAQQLHDA